MRFQNPGISVLQNKQLYIFDLDGTIYLDDEPFSYAIRFIKHLRAVGKRVLFFTNNASHSTDFYRNRLSRMGFDPGIHEIMTSGDVTAEFLLRHRAEKTVYLLGTPDLEQTFQRRGIRTVPVGAPADIVITSFDMTLTYEKMRNVCTLVRNGAEYLSTHPDYNCPTKDGMIPDSGAIAAFVTASTGVVPTCFGKPYRPTAEMIWEVTGISRENICIFGDRLYTDIALGKRHGMTAILVCTGETQAADVEQASAADRPDFIFPSLEEVDRAMFP